MDKRTKIVLLTAALIYLGQSAHSEAPNYGPRDYSIVPTTPGVAQLLDFQRFEVDNFRDIPQIRFLTDDYIYTGYIAIV